MKLSTYNKSDIGEIQQLFLAVFSDSEGKEEGLLIGSLVLDLVTGTEDQNIYGFIATENDQIIGSIFFTRLEFETTDNAFILSPVAIHTKHQGKGVGQDLINFGIKHLKDYGIGLAFTYGDPNFYSKVGFECISEEIAKAPLKMSQPEGWLCQSLTGDEIKPIAGKSRCVDALNNPEYW
jgi:putative acetyltransferase